jgi:hypothetical protein
MKIRNRRALVTLAGGLLIALFGPIAHPSAPTALESPRGEPFIDETRWPAPELNEQSYKRWLEFIRASEDELKWRRMRWHKSLSSAALEAKRLERPVLLFTMNGHPCGET